jgi:hypothetical protein
MKLRWHVKDKRSLSEEITDHMPVNHTRKRSRIDADADERNEQFQLVAASRVSPSSERRGKKWKMERKAYAHTTKVPSTVMKHMYSNAPAIIISILPEPFKSAVMNSRLWKWERSQNMETTACLASLFPQDDTQDVSFTIWCGHNDGYFLNNVFGVQREYL